jgi:rod shape determining protein RodA
MFEQRLYRHIDWLLLSAVVALSLIGLAMIFSTTLDPVARADGRLVMSPQFWTQAIAVVLGLGAALVAMSIDYRRLAENSLLLYGCLAALLLYVLFFGVVAGGARRWISLGVFNLQPSEFAKIVLALLLALIAREPDLGSAVTLIPVLLGVVFVAGLQLRFLAIAAIVALLVSPVAWKYGLQDYQRERVVTFVDPAQDPRGAGYQQIQARVTVGSGGLTGKGFLEGTQGQYKFLPVAHNDFIYSVLAEEQGFIGVLVTLGLYLFVLMRALDAARLAKDRVGAYLVVGLVSGFAFQVIYNIAMSAGLAPVKGLTLPLMSYGGSSIIATLAAFGLILNVRMRRFTN